MGTAIPMPDEATEKYLDDARSQAVAGLKGRFPDSMLAPPPPAAPKISNSVRTTAPPNALPPSAPPAAEPTPDAQPVIDSTPPPAPTDTATPVTYDDGVVTQSAKQLGSEVGKGFMRAASATARTLGFAAAGANTLIGDALDSNPDTTNRGNDAIFDFIKNHVDTAYDYWKQDPANTNGAASFVGSAVEGLAPMMLGPAGAATMAANATVEKGKQSVDAGDNAKTAATLALISGLTTTAQLGVGFKDPRLVKQIAKWVGAGAVIDQIGKQGEALTRYILNDQSYKDAIKQVDPLNPTEAGVNAVMQTIFGILHTPRGAKLVKAADPHGDAPPADAVPVKAPPPDLTADEAPPAAPATPAAPAAPAGSPLPPKTAGEIAGSPPAEITPSSAVADANIAASAAKPAPIPDKPSAEPSADLRAQIADMHDPATPRKAVYLSKENVAKLGPEGIKSLAGDAPISKNFDRDGGVLISPNISERSKAAVLRKKNGEDMQKTLGQLTGAGDGKAPDQTQVVQGTTPEGAVATEKAVAPAEVPAAVAATAAEGKTPVVTTPEAAVARRADEIAKEEAVAPTDSATPVSAPADTKPATEAAPVDDGTPKPGDRRIVSVGGHDVPVVVHASPDGNKVAVRMIDEDGRVAKDVRQVPLALFKKDAPAAAADGGDIADSSPPAETPSAEPVSPAAESAHPLEQAVKSYDADNTPPPGKKWAEGGVKGHAERVAVLARALDAHLKTAKDIPEDVRKHAQAAANAAKNLDGKTDEQIAKAQGVSHLSAEARATDIKQAIHNITHPDDVKIPEKVATKAEKLKTKVAEKKAAEAKAAPTSDFAAREAKLADETIETASGAKLKLADAVKAGKWAHSQGDLRLIPKEVAARFDLKLGEAGRVVQAIKDSIEADKTAKDPTKAEKLKAKAAEKAEPKIKSAIADVADETKVRQLNAGDNARISSALGRYLRAGIDDVNGAHDNLERVVHEAYGESPVNKAEAERVMELAREQRDQQEEARRPRAMSDDIDDEMKEHFDGLEGEHSHDDAFDDGRELKMSDADFKGTPMGKLHDALQNSGFWRSIGEARDNGKFLSTHKVLDHLTNVASRDNPVMAHILSKLRTHIPDLPIRPVDKVIRPDSGRVMGATAGLFHPRTASIQVRVHNAATELDRVPHTTTHALIHEIVHGATSFEMYSNPNGKFATEIKVLLAEARSRAGWSEDLPGQHYGLQDEHEFVAESLTNPDFQKFLAESKPVAAEAPQSLFGKVASAISRMLGIKDPRARNLLQDVMASVERGIGDQARNMPDAMLNANVGSFIKKMGDAADRLRAAGREMPHDYMPGLDAALDSTRAHALEDIGHALEEEPAKLQHDDEVRGVVGNATTATARLFRRAIKSGVVGEIGRATRGVTGYGALVRAALRRGSFGHSDDRTNPLRNYDEQMQQRNATIRQVRQRAEEVVNARARLSYADDKKLGQFQLDTQMRGGIDPEVSREDTPLSIRGGRTFEGDYKDLTARWATLSPEAKDVFRKERDFNEWAMRKLRKASVDVALDSYSDKDIPAAKRQLLYSVTDRGDFESLIGKGKEIDVGERNDKLIDSLKDLSSTNEIEGTYFHLGRTGDHVVQVKPEGSRQFGLQSEAEAYASKIRDLSPNSRAKVRQLGGKWEVEYKAEYTSFHKSEAEAEEAVEALRKQGYDVGSATRRLLTDNTVQPSAAMQNIVAESSRRLTRHSDGQPDEGTAELQDSLRQAFVSIMAAKSSYAGSKLARRRIGGVKADEMGKNFANHAQSLAYNIGHLSHVYKIGDALGQLRTAVKDPDVPQATATARGRIYDELMLRAKQDAEQFGHAPALNSTVAKLGFANFMTSLSHSTLFLTQNFTTAIPRAGAKFGMRKATSAFASAMSLMASPSFREAMRASAPWANGHNADTLMSAIMKAVSQDKRFGKWAKGENSPLQQLIDRGAIHTSLSNQLSTSAKGGGNKLVNRVFEYARIMPSMADMFNRVSTGLAALELHNGDVYKAGDFVRETHMDYSAEDKSRAGRAIGKLWGGNSVTMFKTYSLGMAHLLYSNIHDAIRGTPEGGGLGGREEALKTVAGMIVGATLFAGVQRGAGIEPIRAAMYAYNRIAHPDTYYDFDNMSRRAVHEMVGGGKLEDVINGGLPRLWGQDWSSRMGLADLLLKDPPDFSSLDADHAWKFAASQLGPVAEMMVDKYEALRTAMMSGRMDDWQKVVPFRSLNNVYEAYRAGTTGKVTASGAQITDPSVGAAISHLHGFHTAEEAKISEMEKTDADYKQFAEDRKQMMLRTYQKLEPGERAAFWQDKVVPWNAENPGHRIKIQDTLRRARAVQATENVARGLPGKDPVQNELNDY